MNPLTNMKNVLKLSENDLKNNSKTSWHDMYKDSAWIFVGGFSYDLTEGDLLCIFSQYGEIVNINMIRDKLTGKSKGYCFICYEDQRSTILSVDNLNGIRILNRTIRVDHVANYKVPKIDDTLDEETKKLRMEGCAPKPQIPEENIKKEKKSNNGFVDDDFNLPTRLPIANIKTEPIVQRNKVKKEKKSKKNKKHKKNKKEKKSKKKKHKKNHSSTSNSDNESDGTDSDSSTVQHKNNEKQNKVLPSTSTDNHLNRKQHSRSRSRTREYEQRSRHRSRSDYEQQNDSKSRNYGQQQNESRKRDNEEQSRNRSKSRDYEHKRTRWRSRS